MDIKISANVNIEINNVEAESIRDILKYAENETKNQLSNQFNDQINSIKDSLRNTDERQNEYVKRRRYLEKQMDEMSRRLENLQNEFEKNEKNA